MLIKKTFFVSQRLTLFSPRYIALKLKQKIITKISNYLTKIHSSHTQEISFKRNSLQWFQINLKLPPWQLCPRTIAPRIIAPRIIVPWTIALPCNCSPDNCPLDNCSLDNRPPDNCPLDNYPPDNSFALTTYFTALHILIPFYFTVLSLLDNIL